MCIRTALVLFCIGIEETLRSSAKSYRIITDVHLARSCQKELISLIEEHAESTPHEVYTLAQAAVPPLEKIGKRQREQGIVEWLVIAETPQARVIARGEPFILTTQGACSPDFYADHDAYRGLITLYTEEPLTPALARHLISFAQHQKNNGSPITEYYWKSPTLIEITLAHKPVLITAETAITPEFVAICEKIITAQPRRNLRIDGRFDRMIIVRGKEHS